MKFVLARLQVDVLRASSASSPQSTSHRFVGGLYFSFGGTLMNGSVVFFFYHFIIFLYILFGVGGVARVHATRAIGVRMPYVYCAFTACSIYMLMVTTSDLWSTYV